MSGQTTIPVPTLIRDSVVLTDQGVRILDRRRFPFDVSVVDCRTVEDVAHAIEDMVTQSGGPFYAATAAMALAARAAEHKPAAERIEAMAAAGSRLVATRPTNNAIRDGVAALVGVTRTLADRDDFAVAFEVEVRSAWADRRAASRRLGAAAATQIVEDDAILTHCWAETSLIDTLTAAMEQGMRPRVICTETRPYLQGARLTAHSVAELGLHVTVISDGMAAHAMASGMVTRYMTAADRVTLSGHVVNKVGTFQIAIAARAFGVPYVAMVQRPDRLASGPDDVEMEMRDGAETLHCLGHRTASPLVCGWYPAFDVTPPQYVSAVATRDGVFAACDLRRRYA